jgi:hypothetical protein|tara:strand:+ start:662 stop:769 length:108 start_codon:yes stop_codon:yes gene_type:complete
MRNLPTDREEGSKEGGPNVASYQSKTGMADTFTSF